MIGLVKEQAGPGHVALRDLPDPRADTGQVLIRVEAAGICGSDLHILRDDIRLNLRPPVVMGHEFAGVVEATGPGVSAPKPGDRVTAETTFRSCGVCRHCRTGGYNLCPHKELIGYVHNGCFARLCVVPAERVHPLPERLSFLEGALCEPLACCVHGVMEQTGIRPGDVAVVAGVGAIGLLSLQVARACGAQVVVCGTDLDDERLLIARDLGAAQTVNVQRKDANSFAGALTGDEGADVFLECSGAPAAARMGLTLLRRGGRYCQIGLFGSPLDLDFELVAYKELAVSGAIGSRWTSWRTALRLLESGAVRVRPLIGDPLPLGDWQEGFRRFETKQGIKTLLRPD